MIVAMTGVSGNMGREAFVQTMELEFVERINILLTPKSKNDKLERNLKSRYGNRVEIIRGWISDSSACEKLVEGADIVINMAAVIPPRSDKSARASYLCNQLGTMRLTDAVSAMKNQAKFIHVSTVAVYGNRTLAHPWGRVGDPLLPAAFDNYAMHKMIAERYVLESGLKNFAVLRQTAMLYDGIIFSNVSDGLLFHTTLNGPLEWVTARDSGYLIKRILEREYEEGNADFWNNIYDISGGKKNRRTGYDTFADGFSIMGGSPKAYFKPNWCETRNFHGLWFADGALDDMFGYRRDTVEEFWNAMGKKFRAFKAARLLPSSVIGLFVFRRLLGDANSPMKWLKNGDVARVTAAFGGMEEARAVASDWKNFKVENAKAYGSEEEKPLEAFKDKMLGHGYDESKQLSELDIDDIQNAAAFRGGKCLSKEVGATVHTKLLWQCSEGHTFSASLFTVLKGGHWCPFCQPQPWAYDKLAKKSPFYAQVWYDSHSPEEDFVYSFGKDGESRVVAEEEEKA